MSFAAAFYNFSVELSHADRGTYAHFRVKTPRHPNESLEHLFARMLAFCHCYRDGQSFSGGLFEPKEPTIWHKDITGGLLLWAQLGCPERKKLETALRVAPNAEHRIYFFEEQQIGEFCHMLRGSKSNWVAEIPFFIISPSLLEQLVPLERSSPSWVATFVDNQLYLDADGTELVSEITQVEIWEAFQESLLGGADERR